MFIVMFNDRVKSAECFDTVSWAGRKALLLSLRFNGHFPGEPGLAGVY